MNKRTRFSVISILIIIYVLGAFSSVFSQVQGIELYNKLRTERRNLLKYEGERNVRWTPGGEAYVVRKDDTVKKIDPQTGSETNLFDDEKIISSYNKLMGDTLSTLPFNAFTFIEEGKKIRFNKSGRTEVFIYDLQTYKLQYFKVRKPEKGVRFASYEEVFSPNYKYTAYVDDFNIYLRDLEKDETTTLTTDGHSDLRNGYPDWIYAEEFAQFYCFWWSPNSDKIAFMQFDESPVRKFPVFHDEKYDFELEMQSFPRVGENNPIVRIFVIDIETKKRTQVDTGIEQNIYLYNGRWSFDGKTFTIKRMNRLQNKVEILSADPNSGKSEVLFQEVESCYLTEGLGFMQAGNEIYFLPDNKHFLRTSERSGWREIYLYDLTGKLIRPVTKAKLPVQSIQAVDMENKLIYFSAFGNRGMERHLYRVKLDVKKLQKLTKKPGTHAVSVSKGGKYFSDRYSSFDNPPEFNIYKGDGTLVKQLGKSVVTDELNELNLIKPEHFVFKSADGKYDLDGLLYKPANFDKNKKYPVIYSVYCGPSTKEITNRYYSLDFRQQFSQLGFLVVRIDNRGLLNRGKEFETSSYLKLGQVDVDDLVASIKYLTQRSYVDSNRVGIFGGSYGGYMSIMALLKAPEHFHVGAAGSPGVDWRNYDTIYTERYMGLPQYNVDGYEKANPLNYVDNLEGKLLIQHGAVDDNVHPTQVMQLVDALLKAKKRFDWFIYPGQAHGIRYSQARQKQLDFFIRHLEPETKNQWFEQN